MHQALISPEEEAVLRTCDDTDLDRLVSIHPDSFFCIAQEIAVRSGVPFCRLISISRMTPELVVAYTTPSLEKWWNFTAGYSSIIIMLLVIKK